MKTVFPSRLMLMSVGLVLLLSSAAATSLAASKEAKEKSEREELATQVRSTIELFTKADAEMRRFFETSAGYVVFPKIAKGAAGIGAAHGKGQLFEKGGKLAGEASVTQVTIGFQLGGQVYGEVIFFETPEALRSFQKGDFKFSAQVSAVAAAEGASKNAKYELGVLVFTMARGGLMYEASVGGQKFDYTPYP